MADEAWTQGPWSYEPEAYSRDNIYGAGKLLAQAVGDSAETEANARLISAAPDLVVALEEAYRFITQPDRMESPKGRPTTLTYETHSYNALTAKLRAALAKARGEL